MLSQPEPIFQVLAEGGSFYFSRITLNGQQRYLTKHQEHDFTNEGLGINQQMGYGCFEEAFMYINNYPLTPASAVAAYGADAGPFDRATGPGTPVQRVV